MEQEEHMDAAVEDEPMDQTMALATKHMSTKTRGRDRPRSISQTCVSQNHRNKNLEPTAIGVLDAGSALAPQD